ncbi:MAG: viroplasmin family protein [Porphyromonas sp.]|nr:viroplasmin family protein [Porphyromonas sp.]
MVGKKSKWYVVWSGLNPGVYDDWADCKLQIEGFSGAQYRSYPSREEALQAFDMGYRAAMQEVRRTTEKETTGHSNGPIWKSLSVDAACSGNPGAMEYRGVFTWSKELVFHVGPFAGGTNNIGEFLALVHGLALCKQRNWDLPIYSDSKTAMAWVRNKKCKTLLMPTAENAPIFDLIERAEKWLRSNSYSTPIYKWDTEHWLEIPADFGRK